MNTAVTKRNRLRVTCLAALAALSASACASNAGAPGGGNEDEWRDGTLRTESGDVPIHYQLKGGVPLMQGDIALRPIDLHTSTGPESFTMGDRATVFASGAGWPNGTIPYRFDASVSANDALRTTVPQAIAHYQLMTPLTFAFDATNTAPDYILFKTNTGSGCNSMIGHTSGEQDVNLDDGCKGFDTVVHELGHAIGLRHEQCRPDRDSYITIQYGNLKQAKKSNFDIQGGATVGPFDFTSVMLYPAFTGDPTFANDISKPIITRVDGTAYPNPQSGKGLSDGDVAGVLSLYPFAGALSPTVTSISPSTGPNSGGTVVTVQGARFDTSGSTKITFGGAAGSNVICPTTRMCTAVSPKMSAAASAQQVDVQVTVGALTSPAVPQDLFTFTPGPVCTSAFTCQGVGFGFPLSVATCTGNVNFYELFGTSSQTLMGAGTTFTFGTNDVGLGAAACDPATGSCTYIDTFEANKDYCGALPPPPPPPRTCNGTPRPRQACSVGWRCCGTDSWECGVCN